MRRVFVRFLEEIEDSKKAFRNYLTFTINVMVSFNSGQNYVDGIGILHELSAPNLQIKYNTKKEEKLRKNELK